ncbi:MAG: lipocalin-like domain-containing protein [Rhodospirillales bacterium]|nr:lipocalin-like domain-containing protein [Rhodospirillales bacterium]
MTYRERLLGNWRLVSFSAVGADGKVYYPMGQGLVGVIMYTPDGRMSVQLMGPDRPRLDSPAYGAGTTEQWAAAARSFFAYAGTFSVDEAAPSVTHHVEMALNPYWAGRDQVRSIRMDGDDLELSGASPTASGAIDTAYVRWRRLA